MATGGDPLTLGGNGCVNINVDIPGGAGCTDEDVSADPPSPGVETCVNGDIGVPGGVRCMGIVVDITFEVTG